MKTARMMINPAAPASLAVGRIEVSLETIRNWEQGKRCPTGAAKALRFKIAASTIHQLMR